MASIGMYANVRPKTGNLPNAIKIRETGVYHSSCGDWNFVMNFGGGVMAGFNRVVRMGEMAAAIERGCAQGLKTVHFYIEPTSDPIISKTGKFMDRDPESIENIELSPVEQI